MDVTPHDLRNAELREAFRGYRPEEVEELLERAAVTLERLHERNRQLSEKIGALESEGSTAKEMESVLRQTLLLAQRTADETVTAAHDKARHLVEEAEDRALTLTSEAEEQARIVGEAQRAGGPAHRGIVDVRPPGRRGRPADGGARRPRRGAGRHRPVRKELPASPLIAAETGTTGITLAGIVRRYHLSWS